ncbi:MAG TPA: tRNA (adenosine(37)-N6)-threonylcarbamoyltransferase complex dimerization subunit type 1 TsaB [Chondromyces sp.]|nr:tRNA (adenosine(37)-N6)-threonylcarbamoyltransferase complex dimerization subunit type 1 TsaB [Chondromyces sp.]
MKVLAIDTSNTTLGVALLDGGKVVGEYITNIPKNHSLRAMPAVENLMKDCGIRPKELDKIVVANGPGSYTGVRIGVTLAKTLAWSLNIPISGVSSLAVLAASARYYPYLISPIFDARRGQVYTGLYKFDNGKLIQVVDDCNILMTEWCKQLKELKEEVLFIGNDTEIHEETIHQSLGSKALIGEMTVNNPRPSELARLGMDSPTEDLHTFVPNYIRLAEAEVKWLEKQKGLTEENGSD